jgi:hypothetical protein
VSASERMQKLRNEINSLVQDGLISRSYAQVMTQGLAKDFISSADLRFIMDAGIDRVAKKYRIATSKDILEVSPMVAKQISEPLSVRDFSNPVLTQWIKKARGKVPTEILTPAQKAIYEPVAAGLGKLDAKLRNEMQKMINSKEFRAAYGIPADAKLSRQELLGHLIVGPIQAEFLLNSQLQRQDLLLIKQEFGTFLKMLLTIQSMQKIHRLTSSICLQVFQLEM